MSATAFSDRDRAKLVRDMQATERKRGAKRLRELRATIYAERIERRRKLSEARAQCGEAWQVVRAEARAAYAVALEKAREAKRLQLASERAVCTLNKRHARMEHDAAIAEAARIAKELRATREAVRAVTREEKARATEERARRGLGRSARKGESASQAANDVRPELRGLFLRLMRSGAVRATGRTSAGERFSEWCEEHRSEVLSWQSEHAERAAARDVRQFYKAAKESKRRDVAAALEAAGVPF